jgi:hypothetical protein
LSPPNDSIVDFGEPLDEADLADFLDFGDNDIDNALDWWNENASELFVGVLDNG